MGSPAVSYSTTWRTGRCPSGPSSRAPADGLVPGTSLWSTASVTKLGYFDTELVSDTWTKADEVARSGTGEDVGKLDVVNVDTVPRRCRMSRYQRVVAAGSLIAYLRGVENEGERLGNRSARSRRSCSFRSTNTTFVLDMGNLD